MGVSVPLTEQPVNCGLPIWLKAAGSSLLSFCAQKHFTGIVDGGEPRNGKTARYSPRDNEPRRWLQPGLGRFCCRASPLASPATANAFAPRRTWCGQVSGSEGGDLPNPDLPAWAATGALAFP